MKTIRIRISLCVPCLVCGCGDGFRRSEAPVVRDSVGIRIVENPAVPGDTWTVERQVRIGVAEGDERYQFFSVTDATRLSDGRIVVGNSGTGEIKVYDQTGGFLRTLGRRGDGPGEFRYIASLHRLPNDSVLVWDFQGSRVTVYSANLEIGRSELIDRGNLVTLAGRFGSSHGAEYLADGSILLPLLRSLQPSDHTGVVRPPQGFAWASSDLSTTDLLGWFPGIEQINLGSAERPEFTVLPFAPSTVHAMGGWPPAVYIGDQADFNIVRFRTDGTPGLMIRRAGEPRVVTTGDLEMWAEQTREWMSQYYEEAVIERRIADVPKRETMPLFGALAVGTGGDLWVQAYTPTRDDPSRYHVFDVDGLLRADVVLPPRFTVMEIGDDYVLGITLDDADVQFVELYQLQRK